MALESCGFQFDYSWRNLFRNERFGGFGSGHRRWPGRISVSLSGVGLLRFDDAVVSQSSPGVVGEPDGGDRLPTIQHTIEFGIHWMRGTPNLKLSIGTSIVFTIYSTLFNLYSMRRGALLVGQDAQPIGRDIVRFPALFVGFVVSAARGCGRLLKSAFQR